jgi:hypothetical protein
MKKNYDFGLFLTSLCVFVICLNVVLVNGQTYSFSSSSNNALEEGESNPMDLMRFQVGTTEGIVELFWEVPYEKSIIGYEVQRSVNGGFFEKIGWLDVLGDSEIGGAYLFLDRHLYSNETLYYRVKSINSDNQFEYSEVQIVDLLLSRVVIELNPLLATQPSIISIEKEIFDASQNIEVSDANGNLVLLARAQEPITRMDLAKYKDGVYFVKLATLDGEGRVLKIVKQSF